MEISRAADAVESLVQVGLERHPERLQLMTVPDQLCGTERRRFGACRLCR